MGKFTAGGREVAGFVRYGDLAATGAGDWVALSGTFAFALSGDFTGTGRLEVSFDGGATAIPISAADGSVRIFNRAERLILSEPEGGMLYRFVALTRSAGTFRWRFARGTAAASSIPPVTTPAPAPGDGFAPALDFSDSRNSQYL